MTAIDNKSLKLDLDHNKIELIDASEIKTSRSIIKLNKKPKETQTNKDIIKIENYNTQDKTDTILNKTKHEVNSPVDIMGDLELIGNDEFKNQLAFNKTKLPPSPKRTSDNTQRAVNDVQHAINNDELKSQDKFKNDDKSKDEIKNKSKNDDKNYKLTTGSKNSVHSISPIPMPVPKNLILNQMNLNQTNDIISEKVSVKSGISSKVYNFSPVFGSPKLSNKVPIKNAETIRNQTRELHKKKAIALIKIKKLQQRGYRVTRQYGIVDDLEDILAEKERLEEEANLDSGVQFQKNGMMFLSSFIEMGNGYYNPFDINLTGWSDSLNDNADNFEPVFEELYDKYKEQVQLAPELKLALMFIGSGVSYHFSQQLLKKAEKSMPGFGDVMNNNPTLKKQYTDTAAKMFMKTMAKNTQQQQSDDDSQNQGNGLSGLFNTFSGLMGGNSNQVSTKPTRRAAPINNTKLKEPSGVDELLRDINMSTELSLQLNDDLSSHITNNHMKNVQIGSTKRNIKKN